MLIVVCCSSYVFLIQSNHSAWLYVPAQFGYSIIIPLIKNRQDDVNNVDNYRAITLSN